MTGAPGVDPVPTTTAASPAGSHVVAGVEDERSLGQIVGDLSNDLTTLVKQELELARTELKEEAAKAGKPADAEIRFWLDAFGAAAPEPVERPRTPTPAAAAPPKPAIPDPKPGMRWLDDRSLGDFYRAMLADGPIEG